MRLISHTRCCKTAVWLGLQVFMLKSVLDRQLSPARLKKNLTEASTINQSFDVIFYSVCTVLFGNLYTRK